MIWLARLAWYVGLFGGIGSALFHACRPRHCGMRRLELGDYPAARRFSVWLLALAAVAALLSVGLLGVDALDLPLSGLMSRDAWRAAATTSFGGAAALAIIALSCALLSWRVETAVPRRMLAELALIVLGLTLAVSGHASAATPSWLARPAVWLHGVAVALWVGALLPLVFALKNEPDLAALKRFSRSIPLVLLAMLVSGGVLICLQFDRPSSLWQTAYGQVLMLKLALVAVLLGLGSHNRFRLTDAVLRGQVSPRIAMRRIVFLECVVAAGILAVVALWRFTPPPRALIPPSALHEVSAHVHASKVAAALMFTPAPQGHPASLTVSLFDVAAAPLSAQALDVEFSNASAGIEPIVFPAVRVADGIWKVEHIALPRQAAWQLGLDVLVNDFERIHLETTLELSQ